MAGPVSFFEYLELLPQETSEGRSNHCSREGPLGQTSHYQVHVLVVAVDRLQQSDSLVFHCVVQLREGVDGWQAAVLANLKAQLLVLRDRHCFVIWSL